ncbi:MAG TPA: TetR family transcriptional regulator [Solirubrobacteraceae bacterium]
MATSRTITPGRRRHDAQASRAALLQAAGALFHERGYDAATVRDIGDRAGVDPALIARYFGGKEGLYLAALQRDQRAPLPVEPVELLECMLSRSEQRGIGPIPRAMVSSTLSDGMREQVSDIIRRRLLSPITEELSGRGVREPTLRAEILVAIATGVALTRAGGTLPALADAPLEDVLAVLSPLVAALHEGDHT